MTLSMLQKCGFDINNIRNNQYFQVTVIDNINLIGRDWSSIRIGDVVVSINDTLFENWSSEMMDLFLSNQPIIHSVIWLSYEDMVVIEENNRLQQQQQYEQQLFREHRIIKCGFDCGKSINARYFRVTYIDEVNIDNFQWSNIQLNNIIVSINDQILENMSVEVMTTFVENEPIINSVHHMTNGQLNTIYRRNRRNANPERHQQLLADRRNQYNMDIVENPDLHAELLSNRRIRHRHNILANPDQHEAHLAARREQYQMDIVNNLDNHREALSNRRQRYHQAIDDDPDQHEWELVEQREQYASPDNHVQLLNSRRIRSQRTNNVIFKSLDLVWDRICPYCSYVGLRDPSKGEESHCCRNGDLVSDEDLINKFELHKLSTPISDLYIENVDIVSKYSSSLNNFFAIASTGIANGKDHGFEHRYGDHSSTIQGRTYHYIKNITNNLSNQYINGLSYVVFDHDGDLAIDTINKFVGENVDFEKVANLITCIDSTFNQYNHYFRELKRIGNNILNGDDSVRTQCFTATLVKKPQFEEVGIVTQKGNTEKFLKITFQDGTNTNISWKSNKLEPLSYPIFFQQGENGWGHGDVKIISFKNYLTYRMLGTEVIKRSDGRNELMKAETIEGKIIPVNRFQVCARNSQVYYVDMWSRNIDGKLDFIKYNQDKIVLDRSSRMGSSEELEEEEHNENVSTFLPSSFHGSKRHLQQLARNALTIVSELKCSTAFITLTCNIKWPEISQRLLKGQKAYDRPDVVCQVFHTKLKYFIDNLKKGKYFGSRKFEYIVHVIEYQHRGLPHAHIVVKLENVPEPNDDDYIPFIDEHFNACVPILADTSSAEDRLLHELVTKHMQHKCAVAVNGCKKNHDSLCSKGFDQTNVSHTHFDQKGFPVYKRNRREDFRTVTFNRQIILDWKGHSNVEFSNSARNVLYLFNYLYKGCSKQSIRLETNVEVTEDRDEIGQYLLGRFMCAMDATWQILGYQTYPAPIPAVRTIKVKTEAAVKALLTDKYKSKVSDMLIYLRRPEILHHLKYVDLFNKYVYQTTPTHANEVYLLNIPEITDKAYYLCKRGYREKPTLTRMENLYVTAGDIWYLRLILIHRAVISFDDARTGPAPTFTLYTTYQEAAISHDLVKDKDEAVTCFREAMPQSTPSQLRGLFANMMINGFPCKIIFNTPLMYDALTSDYHGASGVKKNKLLKNLQQRLQTEGKSLDDYGFTAPFADNTELERELLKYDNNQQRLLYQSLTEAFPNNEGQQLIEDTIWADISNCHADPNQPYSKYYLVLGPAGTGKTALMKKLQARCRSEGILIQCCASTTLASLMTDGGKTAHSLFKYPVVEDEDDDFDDNNKPQCQLDNTERLLLLNETIVIFWDEFISNHRNLFEAVQKKLTNKLIFVCTGDFCQILPVIPNGSAEQIMNSTILYSDYWTQFHILHLTENMRILNLTNNLNYMQTDEERNHTESQIRYNHTLENLSENISTETCEIIDTDGPYKSIVALSDIQYITDDHQNEAISWLYPNNIYNPEIAMNRVVLCSTNDAVDEWNCKIQELNSENTHILYSHDEFNEVDDPHGYLAKYLTKDILHSINATAVPPHELNLKVNDVCLVLRPIMCDDIATNMRVKILYISTYLIRAAILTEMSNDIPNRVVLIPRMRFKFRMKYGSFQILRTQFPLRLAYGMTINKAQGQTLEYVLFDSRTEPFSHGHTYVAMSRVRDVKNIKMFITYDQIHINESLCQDVPKVPNFVYHQMISLNP